MNINNMLKKISFGCGLASLCLTMQASAYYGGDSCCQPTCCEDGPLSCNAFGIQVKGGVTPSWFTDRGNDYMTSTTGVVTTTRSPEFDKIYDTPWQVGAELQWNASTHVQFFAEYVYEQAQRRKHHFTAGSLSISRHDRRMETNAFYMGARYYFGSIWNSDCMGSIAPFIGFKGGAVWLDNDNNHYHGVTGVTGSYGDGRSDRVSISAGGQIGLDWSINCNWGVVLTVEAVGVEGFGSARHLDLDPATTGMASGYLGHHGQIVSVPVTLGVRYTF